MSLHSSCRAVSSCVGRRAGSRSFSVSATGQKNGKCCLAFVKVESDC